MKAQTVIKYSNITAGIFYLLCGALMVVWGIYTSLSDDREVAITGAFLGFGGVPFLWYGVRRVRDAKRTA